ncbi:MAG: hypothetical protein ACI4Q3_09640 [Kiritimatiellia bacterium]
MNRFSRPARPACPVAPFERKGPEYVRQVDGWLDDPHAFFKSYGAAARSFQREHRSERLRTMTFVAPAADLLPMRPVRLWLGGEVRSVQGWDGVFSAVVGELVPACPATFDALQRSGLLAWIGCGAGGVPISTLLSAGALKPDFASWEDVIRRVQWLLLMCGIKLNDAIVQVDPYTDEQWTLREADIHRKRSEERAFMAGRRAAQKAWAEAHPEEAAAFAARQQAEREAAARERPRRSRGERRAAADPTW